MKPTWLRRFVAKTVLFAVAACAVYAAGFATVYYKTPLYWRFVHLKNRLAERSAPSGGAFLYKHQFVNATQFFDEALDDYPDSDIAKATLLLEAKGFEPTYVSKRELALRLLYFTHNYCSTDVTGENIPFGELFSNCRTMCGGYSHVLRGLLESQGIPTRYANLYNIPSQGNHTGIEYLDEHGHWAFLDPTFGVYFTEDGADGIPLSLQEIAALAGNVVPHQLNRDSLPAFSTPLHALSYQGTERWIHKNMALASYWTSEQTSSGDNSFLPLVVNLSAKTARSIGTLEFTEHRKVVQRWLADTNRLLNDSDPLNDTSFNSANLSGPGERLNILRIRDILPRKPYELWLRFYNWGPSARIEIAKTMRRVSSDIRQFHIGSGNSLVRVRFSSATNRAEFALYSWSDDLVELLGLELRPTAPAHDYGAPDTIDTRAPTQVP